MSKEAIDIKGTRQGLIILLDPNRNYEELKTSLINKMESAQGFFTGAKFALQPDVHLNAMEKDQLENICKEYGLIPVSNIGWPLKQRPGTAGLNQSQLLTGEQTLLIERTLRSGHKVTYPGHITILGDVNPGAEVTAGGNIIIMGTCSGFIHAGTSQKAKSFVIAVAMQRAQIRIMDQMLYCTPDRLYFSPVIAKLGPKGVTLSQYDTFAFNRK